MMSRCRWREPVQDPQGAEPRTHYDGDCEVAGIGTAEAEAHAKAYAPLGTGEAYVSRACKRPLNLLHLWLRLLAACAVVCGIAGIIARLSYRVLLSAGADDC